MGGTRSLGAAPEANRRSVVATAATGEKQQNVQQAPKRRDESRDIGQRRGVERLVDAVHFVAIDNAKVDQLRFGPAGGIELDRQRHQLKEADHPQRHRSKREKNSARRLRPEHYAEDDQKLRRAGGDLRGRRHRLADGHHRVTHLVLDRVTSLVRRDADRRETVAVIVGRRKGQALVQGIVMVAEHALDLDDFHVLDARAFHHRGRGFAAGDATARRDLDVLAVGARHAHLRVEPKQKGNANEDNPERHGENELMINDGSLGAERKPPRLPKAEAKTRDLPVQTARLETLP